MGDKQKQARPAKYNKREPIPAAPEEIARAILGHPDKQRVVCLGGEVRAT